MSKVYSSPYVPPICVVDSVIFNFSKNKLRVLLIKRALDPFKGVYALPGGYLASGTISLEAALEVLERKAGLDRNNIGIIEQLRVFDSIERDPRDHIISIAFWGIAFNKTKLKVGENIQSSDFFEYDNIPTNLAYDHELIIQDALSKLRDNLFEKNILELLLPTEFTLLEAQNIIESIAGTKLDAGNFRKKAKNKDIFSPIEKKVSGDRHRPAQLFKIK